LLAQRRALVVPTFDFLDADLAARLQAYGGALLTGPRAPRLDERMQPLQASLPGGLPPSLDDAAALDAALESLAARAGAAREPPARGRDADTALYRAAGGAPALLCVASRAARPRAAPVVLDGPATVEDVLDGARFTGAALSVPLAPHGVRLLRFA